MKQGRRALPGCPPTPPSWGPSIKLAPSRPTEKPRVPAPGCLWKSCPLWCRNGKSPVLAGKSDTCESHGQRPYPKSRLRKSGDPRIWLRSTRFGGHARPTLDGFERSWADFEQGWDMLGQVWPIPTNSVLISTKFAPMSPNLGQTAGPNLGRGRPNLGQVRQSSPMSVDHMFDRIRRNDARVRLHLVLFRPNLA